MHNVYITIHNALAEAVCCCFHDVGRQGVEISFTVFSFVSYMHIHMPLRMHWPILFCGFPRNIVFT